MSWEIFLVALGMWFAGALFILTVALVMRGDVEAEVSAALNRPVGRFWLWATVAGTALLWPALVLWDGASLWLKGRPRRPE